MPDRGQPVHILDALYLAWAGCGGRTRFEVLLSLIRCDADVTTIADRLGVYPSQVSRCLHAMERDGLALRTSRGRRRVYSLGPAMARTALAGGGLRITYRIAAGAAYIVDLDTAKLAAMDARLGIPPGTPLPGLLGFVEPKGAEDPAPPAGAPAPPRPTIAPG